MTFIHFTFITTPLHKFVALLARLIPPLPKSINVSDWWHQQLTREQQHFVVNIMIGWLIAMGLHLFHGFAPVREFEDRCADTFMQLTANATPHKSTVAYTLLDIDDASFERWGEPFFTPRDKLRTLVTFATRSQAKVVIVDIDLRRAGDAHYASLLDALARYDQFCTSQSCPSIILIRSFKMPDKKELAIVKPVPPRLAHIVQASPHIHWASSLYDVSKDQYVRYWNLWQAACDSYGKPQIFPSAQLLAVVLARSEQPERAYPALMQRLQTFRPDSCARGDVTPYKPVKPLLLHDLHIDFDQEEISRRVFYSLPWHNSTAHTASGELLLHTIPAHLITDASAPLSPQPLRNRIVIIGASHAESGDIHITPLAAMPGTMVILNAIHSLQQMGDVVSPHWSIKLLIEALLILIMSIAFLVFRSFWGMVVSGVTIMLLLLPATILLIGHGIWLDFALPLLAVQLHQMASEFEEGREKRRGSP